MKNEAFSRDKILELLNQGYSLQYFYLDGGVCVHDSDDKPIDGYCPIETFLALREEGVIEHFGRHETGYPYYADNAKSDVYKIAKRLIPRTLTPDQFVCLAGIDFKIRIPGEQVLKDFGFDPDLCKIQVDAHGNLDIKQEGYNVGFMSSPGFWAEVLPVPQS